MSRKVSLRPEDAADEATPDRHTDLGHCSQCELNENLWLCLQCGNLGCGRAQYGGIGGHSHGLAHATASSHPVAVKLGSLTPEGTADIYCYACDEERTDPELRTHLAHWGINVADRTKTEKSLTEMQIEHNLSYDFSMTADDGRELTPVVGPGFTGLKNLGNSCYLASIVQCLFAQEAFRARYYHPDAPPPPSDAPAEDLETQLRKIADGLLSGRYALPDPDVNVAKEGAPQHQRGLAPAMLKHLVGRGHAEFATMRQQDAFELLLHLLKLIAPSAHPAPLADPVDSFRFVVEQRLQCSGCRKVRYRTDAQDNLSIPVPARPKPAAADAEAGAPTEYEPVTLSECLDLFTAPESVELTCPACAHPRFTKRTRFRTLPRTLAVNVRRFQLVNWVPTKLDIPVLVDSGAPTDLAAYLSPGPQADEELLPEDEGSGGGAPAFKANEGALAQLEAMGFPRVRCEKALHATGNADAEAAAGWLFGHMEDPDIDTPVTLTDPSASGGGASGGGGGGASVSEESVETLGAMGIAAPQARKALRETGGDVNRALDWVFSHPEDPGDVGDGGGATAAAPADTAAAGGEKSVPGSAEAPARYGLASIVCHKGASIHAGHYVAFVRAALPGTEGEGRQWVLFNDEKVVRGADAEEMGRFAYVYFFEREGA